MTHAQDHDKLRRRSLGLCAGLGLGFSLLGLAAMRPARATEPDTAPLLARIRQRLQTAPVLRGQFEQVKRVQGFKNPLVSRGEFLVARDHGIVWHTLRPFESTLVVTRDRLQNRQADGSVSSQLDARDEPGLRAVNALLFALMAADLETLAQRFHIQGTVGDAADAQDWRISLRPRDAALAQWLSRVELQGDRYLRGATLVEARGDESLIRFSAQATAERLSPAEVARFD
ncbi:hypothetical protein AZ34_08735 [Hylemonella gracilis str. Niagara R]|uniref:Outer membrane lipoprotein carrier protein LolA n=1 Tax=Hylemonella gracilis str. Niagara R TaxID=1458275 RepID=A0A016XGY9_9BURK|nr:outer membrane lipoprotein carrier protein LolA [Hylemonella gracilis]EYC51160.1 hypothetical protein AZ34_08735 [Hylemonella gracilis str. Niagara R]